MENLTSSFASLLRSGEYSDFKLSPVIATALRSGFQEARTRIIEVNFELSALECMLDFMYTGSYSTAALQPGQPAQSTPNAGNEIGPALSTVSDVLLYHARVNAIADYYGVVGLAKTSATKIQELLLEQWCADAFCNLVQEAWGLADKSLHRVLVEISEIHLYELISRDIFADEGIASYLTADVLKASTETSERRELEVRGLQDRIKDLEHESETLKQSLDEIAAVLSKTRACCKRGCKQQFGCVIQKPSQNAEGRWFILLSLHILLSDIRRASVKIESG
ncbi:hypothetical protein ONZ43_g4824 [Nemania bipapillata]|uniref:Uncharacterized protein n=1 Tax=Nemania bipapillata TaxID=110536 RepID=A0ACC2II08_9PEZI|nr:hypothetical protein ONZ43_g4824 [Nemania bipapillata]